MAYLNTEYCHRCERDTPHINGECGPCSERESREKIAAWNALTTEEKLIDLRKRVEHLEHGPARSEGDK